MTDRIRTTYRRTPSTGIALLFASLLGLTLGCANSAKTKKTEIDHGPLVLADAKSGSHDVDAIRAEGKSVALVFWQTWCIACRKKAPALVAAAKAHNDVRFFGVVSGSDAIVDAEELASVTSELELPFPQTRDRDGSVAARFGVTTTPYVIVLGPDGQVTHRGAKLPEGW